MQNEDRFTNWLKKEVEYRRKLMHEATSDCYRQWYKAQVGILETVIKELPSIGMPIENITQDDIWKMADEAYKRRTGE